MSHLAAVLAQDVQQAISDMQEEWKQEELDRVIRAHERMGRQGRGTIWSVDEDEDGDPVQVYRVSF